MSQFSVNSTPPTTKPETPQNVSTAKTISNYVGHGLKKISNGTSRIGLKLIDITHNIFSKPEVRPSPLSGRTRATVTQLNQHTLSTTAPIGEKLANVPKHAELAPNSYKNLPFGEITLYLTHIIDKAVNGPAEGEVFTKVADLVTEEGFETKVKQNISLLEQKLKEIQTDLEKSSGKLTPELKTKITQYVQLADKMARFSNFILRNITNGVALGNVNLTKEQGEKLNNIGKTALKFNDQLQNLTIGLKDHLDHSHIRALIRTPEIESSTVSDSLNELLKQQGVTIYNYPVERPIGNAVTNFDNIPKELAAGKIYSPERFDGAIKEEQKIQKRLNEQISLNQEFPNAESEGEIAKDGKLLEESKVRESNIKEFRDSFTPDVAKWPASNGINSGNISEYTAMLYQMDENSGYAGKVDKQEFSNYMTGLLQTTLSDCGNETEKMKGQLEKGEKTDSFLSARYRDVHTTMTLLLKKENVREALGEDNIHAMENMLAQLKDSVDSMSVLGPK
ncbi:MAG: hypothetical protein WC222_09105 [Parachlamydiales bacterium]|jgi:hypothetical protein